MRENFKRSAITVVTIIVLSVCSIWAQSAKVDLTGEWTFTVESAAGTSMPAVTFKQEGQKLTGHYSSALVGEAELTGTVKGQTIEFIVAADVQGTKLQLTYTGTIESKDSMKGKLSLGELGDGTFSAKRK
jgi:hypothetical protein